MVLALLVKWAGSSSPRYSAGYGWAVNGWRKGGCERSVVIRAAWCLGIRRTDTVLSAGMERVRALSSLGVTAADPEKIRPPLYRLSMGKEPFFTIPVEGEVHNGAFEVLSSR